MPINKTYKNVKNILVIFKCLTTIDNFNKSGKL